MPNDTILAADAAIACRPGEIYRISGGAELCLGIAGRAGTLRPFVRLGDGALAFGVPTGMARLVLRPLPGGQVVAIALDGLPDVPARVDDWVATIADRARYLPEPDGSDRPADLPPNLLLEPGGLQLEPGVVGIPSDEAPLWILAQADAGGNDWGNTGAAPLPALRVAPLHIARAAQVEALETQALASAGLLEAALDAFHARLGARLDAFARMEGTRFAHHLTQVADADAAGLARAMSALGTPAADPAARRPRHGIEPPLLEMMRLVAETGGARLPPDVARGVAGDDDAALKILASNAGLRVREVRLRANWWQTVGEGMVGRLLGGTPVALLPTGRGWRILRPGTAPARAIDAAEAAQIDPHAFVLYRGFADNGESPGRALIAFVLRQTRRDWGLIGGVSLAAGVLGMASPFLSGMLIQSVIPDGVRSEIAQLIIAMLAVSFGAMGFELVRSLAVLRVESLLGSSIEGALWNRLLRLPPAFFRNYGAGDLAMRADAVNQMRRTLGFATITALISVIFSVVNLAVLFSYGLLPAMLALGVCLVELVILVGMALFNMSIQRAALRNGGVMQTLTVQIFQGITKLRVAAAESRLLARWTRLFAIDQKLHFRSNAVGSAVSAFGAGWNILVMAALIALVGLGGAKMSLGDYVTYSGVSGQFVAATLSLASLLPALTSMIPLWERARPILVEPTEDAGGRVHPGPLRGDVEAVGVSFSHPGGQSVLRDVSLRVPAGSFVAIVGPSGSGKSTLLRLLLGFDTPERGTVLLDDHDLRDLDSGAVRRQLGVVLQHSRIEAGSLYQNIAGASTLSLDEAAEAAILAGLGPDIAGMPMGMHTFVDDSGSTLSGGQRQRLLLARAIARRPRLMLLDEATSALDNATQAHVMETLARLAVTRIVVAHRLSTVREADQIIVLSEGQVVERGTYAELAAAEGLFADLIRRQLA